MKFHEDPIEADNVQLVLLVPKVMREAAGFNAITSIQLKDLLLYQFLV